MVSGLENQLTLHSNKKQLNLTLDLNSAFLKLKHCYLLILWICSVFDGIVNELKKFNPGPAGC